MRRPAGEAVPKPGCSAVKCITKELERTRIMPKLYGGVKRSFRYRTAPTMQRQNTYAAPFMLLEREWKKTGKKGFFWFGKQPGRGIVRPNLL